MWKIEKIVKKGDYNYAVVSGYPHSIEFGYVLEHRIVVENNLGRLLNPSEVVHHINGDKKDNRIDNLEVMTVSGHAIHHGKESTRKYVELICPQCGKSFVKPKNQTCLQKKSEWTSCSNSCRGKFSRNIQLNGKTSEVEAAISGNIVREFDSHDNPEETN